MNGFPECGGLSGGRTRRAAPWVRGLIVVGCLCTVTRAAAALSGDADCNGVVDRRDVTAVIAALMEGSSCAGADANADQRLTAADLVAEVRWLAAVPPTQSPTVSSTPEPPTVSPSRSSTPTEIVTPTASMMLATSTPGGEATPSFTATPVNSATSTGSVTFTRTPTPSPTPAPADTATVTATVTPAGTSTPTGTVPLANSATPTNSSTPTSSVTP